VLGALLLAAIAICVSAWRAARVESRGRVRDGEGVGEIRD
jgi:hypothetical protein